MVRWLIGSSIKSRRVVLALAAVVVAFGVWHLRDLKADALPDFGPPTVQIQTEAPGLAPAEVEGLVTLGLEHDANFDISIVLPKTGDYFINVKRPTEAKGTSRFKLTVMIK